MRKAFEQVRTAPAQVQTPTDEVQTPVAEVQTALAVGANGRCSLLELKWFQLLAARLRAPTKLSRGRLVQRLAFARMAAIRKLARPSPCWSMFLREAFVLLAERGEVFVGLLAGGINQGVMKELMALGGVSRRFHRPTATLEPKLLAGTASAFRSKSL